MKVYRRISDKKKFGLLSEEIVNHIIWKES